MKNDYEQQAQDFLNKTGATISINYLKTGKHFQDDKDERDIYEVEIKRGSRTYKFNFGNSLAHSGKYIGHKNLCLNSFGKYLFSEKEYSEMKRRDSYAVKYNEIVPNKNFAEPTAYSVLACLQKYEVGTFEDFCGEFGYDTDSKKAEKTYHAVKEEYLQIAALFSEAEISELQEIN